MISNPYTPQNQATNTNNSGLNGPSTTYNQPTISEPRQYINMSHITNDPHASGSTQNSRSRGIHFWNEYAKQNPNVPRFDQIRPTHQLNKYANGYIEFLLNLRKDKDDEFYAYGSLPTYFSGWKNALMHENNFQNATGSLLRKIYSDFAGLHEKIKNKAFERAINEGEIVHNAELFLREGIMEELLLWILQNPRQNSHALGWRDACILAFLRCAVGRGGEIGTLKWNGSFFNAADDVMDVMWLQKKTAKVDRMRFVHDERWKLSVFVMLGGYIATKKDEFRKVSSDNGKEHQLIFDDLPVHVSTHVTTVILNNAKKKESMKDKRITSHCIRYGAIDDLISNELLETIAALVRGGWELGDFCTGFTYMDLLRFDLQAARVIAGQKDPFLKQAAPSLDFCKDEDMRTKLQLVADRLFCKLPFSSEEGDSLYSLKSVLLAAALENLEDMEAELGRSNQYLENIECAIKLEASMYFTQAKEIGRELAAQRREFNSNLREEKDFAYKTSLQLEKQGEKIEELTSLLKSRDEKMDKLQDMLQKVVHMLGNISMEKNTTSSPCDTDKIPCGNELSSESDVNSSQTSDGSGDNTDESVEVMMVEEAAMTLDNNVQNVSEEAHNFSSNVNLPSQPKQVKLIPLSISAKNKPLMNAFTTLGAGQCRSGAQKDFSDYGTLSIIEFVTRVYTNECKLFLDGDNPLNVKGKNKPRESCKFIKFLASFCENMEEYADLTGDGRDMKMEWKTNRISQLTKHGKNLGELLQGRVNAWELPETLVQDGQSVKYVNCGRIPKVFIKKKFEKEDFHCKIAHVNTWPQIKEKMEKHFKELKKKAAAAKAAQEKANGEVN